MCINPRCKFSGYFGKEFHLTKMAVRHLLSFTGCNSVNTWIGMGCGLLGTADQFCLLQQGFLQEFFLLYFSLTC